MHEQDEASYEQIIGGRYALYGPIASGGMATVHFGRQLGAAGFARTVAIKRLRGEFLDSHEFISTLLDEARLASRIRHPNVVATLDMVAAEDELFLVMEYVVGESLSRLLSKLYQQGKRPSPKIATGILCGVLHALHAAHEATDERGDALGIVHRDVSPQNILVGADGLSRLLDFGIAKGKGRLQTTRAGQLKGKVGYMAPEQILGEEPDRRSDIYAAAVVLWEVLTGRRLFPTSEKPGDNFNLIPKILEADIDPPSEVAKTPKAIDGIVMRGLNRQRDARYGTAREFAVALEETVGVATNRQIGEWVDRVAAEELAERARHLQALEAATRSTDRSSVERIADAAVMRQRRKRRESLKGGSGFDGTTTRKERKDESNGGVDDPATEVEEGLFPEDGDDTTMNRQVDVTKKDRGEDIAEQLEGDDDDTVKRTRLGVGGSSALRDAAEEAKRREVMRRGDDDEDLKRTSAFKRRPRELDEELKRTSHWKRDQIKDEHSEGEMETSVYAKSKLLKGPPKLPGDDSDSDDDTFDRDGPRPSDFRPSRSSAPPSSIGGDYRLPVRSNRWVMIVLVIAAIAAGVAAAWKMTT